MPKEVTVDMEKIIENIDQLSSRSQVYEVSRKLLNILMAKEREIKLRDDLTNKANGYYERQLVTELGNMDISVPRDRKGEFRPSVLPEPWQRHDKGYNNLLTNLVLSSYTPNQIKNLLREMQLPYSPEEIKELKEELYQKATEFRNRELPSDVFAIYIDAYHTDIKNDENRISKAVIYTILGIDMEGNKNVYGYYTFFGTETKKDWLVILNNLISRGLKRVMLVVSDDFSGLADAIKVLFPKSEHQLCFVHMQRNVKRHMSKEDARLFNNQLSILRRQSNYEDVLSKFIQLCEQYINKYPHFIKSLKKKKELYFSFLKYPHAVQKHIYTTNPVENLNSRIEVSRVKAGGYFQSVKTAETTLFVVFTNIHKNKWKKPLYAFRTASYEIQQLFNSKFLS